MKRLFFCSLLIIVFVSSYSYSQTPKGPVIKFESDSHDYGTLYQEADGNCYFKFKNEGDEPLILSNVRSSCGCTVPEWPKDPIFPGKSSSIKVTYDTKRLGTISKQVYVTSNATEPSIVLSIKGNVIQKPSEIMPVKDVNSGFTPTAH